MKNILDTHVKAYQGNNLYDFDNEIILNWYPYRIIKHAGNSKSMLELGLGHGFTSDIFSKHFEKYIVLDGSSAVIENFRKKYPESLAQVKEVYFENYSTDEKFDIINMGFILEHVDNPFQILTRFKNFLSDDGKMFVSVPNAEVLNRRLGNKAGILPDMTKMSENDLLLGHKRYYTVETLTHEIENAGYRVENMEGIYLKPFTTMQILSLDLKKEVIHALCEVGVNYPELSCAILAQIKKLS
jgi:2-polyprenyl-3-methyl-5-hydroxy-6-metoxy-1,4-benzoquinol methylase